MGFEIYFIIIYMLVWLISEFVLYMSIDIQNKKDLVWLMANIAIPIIPCVVYKITHKVKKEE